LKELRGADFIQNGGKNLQVGSSDIGCSHRATSKIQS
jgi:hypothetical protein